VWTGVFVLGKKPALGPNPQSFRLENLLGRSKRLLGALAVLLPDILNGGGDNNHNFGSPFCNFCFFVWNSFDEGIY
jgi:hypothetical protein